MMRGKLGHHPEKMSLQDRPLLLQILTCSPKCYHSVIKLWGATWENKIVVLKLFSLLNSLLDATQVTHPDKVVYLSERTLTEVELQAIILLLSEE